MTRAADLQELAAEWRRARRLYPVYVAAAKLFALDVPPCKDLEYPIDRSEPEVIARVRQWLDHMEEVLQPHHLRQLLQTTNLSTEENLRVIAQRHLSKEKKTGSDRDKVDFLLVQYFAGCAPASTYYADITMDEVARVLEPLLGEGDPNPPSWLSPLEASLERMKRFSRMRELLSAGVLDEARRIKTTAGDMYFGSSALVAFTRFNFTARRTFFRLMRADLDAIQAVLNELEARGVATVDCTRAQLGSETLATLREICGQWKTPFRAEYSSGHSFDQISEIRAAVEEALRRAPEAKVAKTKVGAAPSMPRRKQETQPSPEPLPKLRSAPAQALETPVQALLRQLVQHLKAESKKGALTTATVTIGDGKIQLSSWELTAFLNGHDDVSDAVRRGVSARGLLFDALEKRKRGGDPRLLTGALAAAHAEAALMQERLAAAREKKNIDAAINLAATTKRLLAVMDEADKLRQSA